MRRRIVFAGPWDKADWIDGMSFVDARLPLTRSLARRIACAHSPNDAEGVARDFHRFCRDAIRYVPDPSWEELSDSDTTIGRGYGDCDDKVRAFVSLCRSTPVGGLDARVRPVFDHDDDFYHVQAEARWPGSARYTKAQPGGWLLVELILLGCELGDAPRDMPHASTGGRVLV